MIDNEVYWVYQISSWRDEFYTVSRIRPDGVKAIVAVAGGGCPRDFRRALDDPVWRRVALLVLVAMTVGCDRVSKHSLP